MMDKKDMRESVDLICFSDLKNSLLDSYQVLPEKEDKRAHLFHESLLKLIHLTVQYTHLWTMNHGSHIQLDLMLSSI